MKIAVCCWIKDEDKIIREWIAHYLNLGFDKIYLFDNMSSIPVSSYISHPNVIIKLDNNPKEGSNWGQTRRYNEFLNENRDMDWIFCCDADELLSLRINKSLKDFLSEFSDDIAVIPVNWVTFGQGGNKKFDNTKLVIEQFTIREEYKCFWNFFVKSFIRPNLITEIVNWHYHDSGKYKSKNVYNEHIPSSKQSTIKEVTQNRDRLNCDTPLVLHHYMTLDKESMRIKRNRNNNILITCDKYTDEWYSKNFKDNVKDESMLKYVSDIKKTIFFLQKINNTRILITHKYILITNLRAGSGSLAKYYNDYMSECNYIKENEIIPREKLNDDNYKVILIYKNTVSRIISNFILFLINEPKNSKNSIYRYLSPVLSKNELNLINNLSLNSSNDYIENCFEIFINTLYKNRDLIKRDLHLVPQSQIIKNREELNNIDIDFINIKDLNKIIPKMPHQNKTSDKLTDLLVKYINNYEKKEVCEGYLNLKKKLEFIYSDDIEYFKKKNIVIL